MSELKNNGYILCKGKMLSEFKLHFAHEIDFASKTTQLGLFDFRAFLNIGMLLSDSEKAKKLRSVILDIVIATINEKAGEIYKLERSRISPCRNPRRKLSQKFHVGSKRVC